MMYFLHPRNIMWKLQDWGNYIKYSLGKRSMALLESLKNKYKNRTSRQYMLSMPHYLEIHIWYATKPILMVTSGHPGM